MISHLVLNKYVTSIIFIHFEKNETFKTSPDVHKVSRIEFSFYEVYTFQSRKVLKVLEFKSVEFHRFNLYRKNVTIFINIFQTFQPTPYLLIQIYYIFYYVLYSIEVQF